MYDSIYGVTSLGRGVSLASLWLAFASSLMGCAGGEGDGHHHGHPNGCPADHDHFADGGLVKSTEAGLYRVALHSDPNPPHKGMAVLTLDVSDGDGHPVTGATVEVSGTMPAHGHGLGSTPHVSELGGGTYRVDNVLFQMAGYWVLTVRVDAGGERDAVAYHLCLEEGSGGGDAHVHADGGEVDGGGDQP